MYIPFSIVPALLSAFFFSLGTFWNGANSTTAIDSLPTGRFQDEPFASIQPRNTPFLSLKRCPSYSLLKVARISSSLNAIYAREGMFSLFSLPS